MKRYKVNEILKMLKADGWELARIKGDHRQFRHRSKPGTKIEHHGKVMHHH